MGKKLTEEKKNLIRKRLVQGQSIKEIAEEVQVSERTILRYKKESPAPLNKIQASTGDNSIKVNYTTYLTKREEVYAEKIKKELLLYDDETEGWVWHLTKGDARLKTSGYWWSVVVYPESAPVGWIEKLKAQGFRIAISPLHDKDTWNHDSPMYVDETTGEIIDKGELYKVGDRKKAHWHVIIVVDKRTGYAEMNNIIREICHCPCIQKCRSLRNAYDYFLHINAPEKYQGYDKDEIQTYNNFHIEPTKYEINVLVGEMIRLIDEHDIMEWADCVEFFMNDPELLMILSAKTGLFMGYVKSRYYRVNPNIVKYTEVKHVEEFEFEKNGRKYFTKCTVEEGKAEEVESDNPTN